MGVAVLGGFLQIDRNVKDYMDQQTCDASLSKESVFFIYLFSFKVILLLF